MTRAVNSRRGDGSTVPTWPTGAIVESSHVAPTDMASASATAASIGAATIPARSLAGIPNRHHWRWSARPWRSSRATARPARTTVSAAVAAASTVSAATVGRIARWTRARSCGFAVGTRKYCGPSWPYSSAHRSFAALVAASNAVSAAGIPLTSSARSSEKYW